MKFKGVVGPRIGLPFDKFQAFFSSKQQHKPGMCLHAKRAHLMPGPNSSSSQRSLLRRHATESSKSSLLASFAETSLLTGTRSRTHTSQRESASEQAEQPQHHLGTPGSFLTHIEPVSVPSCPR